MVYQINDKENNRENDRKNKRERGFQRLRGNPYPNCKQWTKATPHLRRKNERGRKGIDSYGSSQNTPYLRILWKTHSFGSFFTSGILLHQIFCYLRHKSGWGSQYSYSNSKPHLRGEKKRRARKLVYKLNPRAKEQNRWIDGVIKQKIRRKGRVA